MLEALANSGKKIPTNVLEDVRFHIQYFQHERLVHELVMILFALLSVGGIFFYVAYPELPIFLLDVLFFALLIPYVMHYYGLENGVQALYEVYDRLVERSKE